MFFAIILVCCLSKVGTPEKDMKMVNLKRYENGKSEDVTYCGFATAVLWPLLSRVHFIESGNKS